MNGRCDRRGFTMVELLTVVSVIAILVALLLPALAVVRSQAKRAVCAAHLRQIGLGLAGYANDNDGLLPDSAIIATGLTTVRWSELLADYTDAERNAKADGTGKLMYGKRTVLTGCPEWKAAEAWLLGLGMSEFPDRPARPNATLTWDYRAVNANMVHLQLAAISNRAARLSHADAGDFNVTPATAGLTRHKGAFNGLFYDGHVQRLSGLAQLTRVVDRPDLGLP